MERRQFIKGSAILGMTIAGGSTLVSKSGMYHGETQRKIYRILNADGVNVGTLPVMRAFAGGHTDYVSPYVLFDEFGPVETVPGSDPFKVEAHPHAGVTPTSYFVAGSGHHRDSLDYDFNIGEGDFMMFSAGKGAIHMEEYGDFLEGKGSVVHGFQIWLNTPSQYKFDAPSTIVHRTESMGKVVNENYSIQVILGELAGVKSTVETHSPAFYYHVKMKADARVDIPTDPNHNAFIYLIDGQLELHEGKQLKKNQVVLYERGDSLIKLYAETDAEMLVLGGQPLDEVVYSYGPFVMNTREQINQCIRDYNEGKMGNPELINK